MITIRGAAFWLLLTIAMSARAASAGNQAEQATTGTACEETRWRPCYVEFAKHVENSIHIGWRCGRYYPYPSPEGGMPTIGYGHKIHNCAELQKLRCGVTPDEAVELLKKDLDVAWVQAALILKRDGCDINSLGVEQREMLVDYAFNGCLHQFKRFRAAVVRWNYCSMVDEYRRYYHAGRRKLPLKDRNECFARAYLVSPGVHLAQAVELAFDVVFDRLRAMVRV